MNDRVNQQSAQNAATTDIVQALDRLTVAAQLGTQINRSLPPAAPVPAIPQRVGVGKPTLI